MCEQSSCCRSQAKQAGGGGKQVHRKKDDLVTVSILRRANDILRGLIGKCGVLEIARVRIERSVAGAAAAAAIARFCSLWTGVSMQTILSF